MLKNPGGCVKKLKSFKKTRWTCQTGKQWGRQPSQREPRWERWRAFKCTFAQLLPDGRGGKLFKCTFAQLSSLGQVTLLFNNAGIMPCKPLLDHSEKEIEKVWKKQGETRRKKEFFNDFLTRCSLWMCSLSFGASMNFYLECSHSTWLYLKYQSSSF